MTFSLTIKRLGLGLFALILAVSLFLGAQPAAAQSDDDGMNDDRRAELLERIQELTQLINTLQEQLNNARGEVREARQELRAGLRRGAQGEDVEDIQEILATDSDIYPEGLTTGYFGPLTSRALERFQQKFDLPVTGTVDEDTREALEELLSERFGDGRVPPGLLRAPGIMKKVQERLQNRDREQFCDDDGNIRARGLLCPHNGENDDEENEDKDENENEHKDEAMDDAQSAIGEATDMLVDAAADIDDAEGETAGVDSMLGDAQDLLDEAQDAFDDEDYEEAAELAEDAEELADDIRDVLDGDDDDRIVMITATVGDDDTEVETETNDSETDTFTVAETNEDTVTAEVADETGLPESYVAALIDFE